MQHIAHFFRSAVERHATRPATRVMVDGHWQVRTYEQLDASVQRIAQAMVRDGVQAGDRVAIIGHNWPEWTQVDLACSSIGAVSVPIYPTSTLDQIRHILVDSGCRLAFVETPQHAQRVLGARTSVAKVVSFFPIEDDGVVALPDYVRVDDEDRELLAAQVEARLAAVDPEDLVSIIYTSGTTGDPKGVMIQHKALAAIISSLDARLTVHPSDHSLCFLPLSHALERAFTTFVISHGCMNTYVPDPRLVSDMMVTARPTLMASVPKLYEKVYATAHEKVAGDPAKKKIFDWALRVGGQCQRAHRKGRTPSLFWRAQLPLADKLVLSSIRSALGGSKTILACGGAPLRREVEEFMSAVGLPLLQGYGMTEASPLISFNMPGAFKVGTCGQVMPGGELGIGEGGEILYRGPNVMKGYWNNPEATAETIDEDGWLHTGDGGYVDTDGYLVINDRLKDIIVTLNGKNVAPQPIEGMLAADPLFETTVLLGDNRPCLTLLVKPSMPHLAALAERRGISFVSPHELVDNHEIVDEIRRRVAELTSKLPSHEQIRDLRLMMEDFTLDNGLLTPTLKVKRREVEKRFGALVDEMYSKLAERRSRLRK